MFYWQAKRWMASSPHLCCCCRFIIRNGGAVWKGETETERVAAFFLFLFHFFILFLRGENAAAGEACRRCFGFYCVSPSSRSTKEFLPPPSHSLTPSTPPQRPINVTSPSPCPAPPSGLSVFFHRLCLFLLFSTIFISNSLKAAIRSSAIFKITPGRWGNTPSVPFPPHFPYLFAGVGLWNKSMCVFGGAVVSYFLFLFAPLWKINKSPLSFKCSANLLQKTVWFHRQQKDLLLSSSSSTLSW